MTDTVPTTPVGLNGLPLGGAVADEDDAWDVAAILTRAWAVGPDGPGMASLITDLALLVAAEVDHFEHAEPLPPPLHRLRCRTVALLRRTAPAPRLHDRVTRQMSLALLLFHSGGLTGERAEGGPTARITECLQALHILEDAYECLDAVPAPGSTVRSASGPGPDPLEVLHLLFQVHAGLDDLLDLAHEFRAEVGPKESTPGSTALRKLAGELQMQRQHVLARIRRLTPTDDQDLRVFSAVDVLTELQRLLGDGEAMASERVEQVLQRARRTREEAGIDPGAARALHLLEARVELKWNLEHRLDTPQGKASLLATLDYLEGVRHRGDEAALRESVLFAEGAIHAVNAGLLPVSRAPDIVGACDTALAGLPPRDSEYPSALLIRSMARGVLVRYSLSEDAIAGVIDDVSRALPLVPPDHPGVPNALLVLSHSLMQRSHITGSVADTRKALALLNRYASDTLLTGPAAVVLRLLQALSHLVFHQRAGSEDVDCDTPLSRGVNHVDAALLMVRRTMDRLEKDRLGEVLTSVACQFAAQCFALAAQLPGRDSAALATEALPWAERACAVVRPNTTDHHHILMLRDWLLLVSGDDGDAKERLLSYVRSLTGPADSADPEAGLARLLRGVIGLAGAAGTDSTVAELRAAADESRRGSMWELRIEGAMRLAEGLRKRALSHSWSTRMESLDAALPDGSVPPEAAPLLELARARFDQVRAARVSQPDPGGPDPEADFAESRLIALGCLREYARTVMGQDDTADALILARAAGALAQRAARWAAYDRAWDDVVRALETGRSIVEQTRLRPDTAARLRAVGRHDLADRWERRPSAPAGALPYRPGDPGRDLSVPDQLAAQVAHVLDADRHGRAEDVPTVASVAAALRAVGAHALVYLLPSPPPEAKDMLERGAVLVTPDGNAEWVPLPAAPGDDAALTRYVEALRARTRPEADDEHRSATVAHWRAALADLSERSGRSQLSPLLRELASRCGRRADGRHRVVLVPAGELAFVPWAAAVLDQDTPAVDQLVMTTVCGARQLIAASALPPVRAGEEALLVNGLTADQADWAATSTLREAVYPRATVADAAQATGPWLLRRLSETAHKFTVVDIAAHLMADVTESWRARIALPDGGLRIDQISALDLAGPTADIGSPRGVCVSLACCASNVSLSHPDEGFTVASAFLAARAGAVIASLWPLTNATTGFLMAVFHYHLRRGHEPAEALRRAQRWMRDPDRRAPARFPAPLARAFEARVARFEASLREKGDSMTSPAHWAGVVHLGR
ncbi:CHAT domain-containing protein [Streptomyces kebangsaanensis]|uniref:CHAT domain-containing protein n=1 Tax=Streptomyces kebangsaanensis TaxID=864058 RepID=UPI00093B9B30|nr:CHAT domain-containing protein [Streptomyces kebangsaanensis]